MPNYTLDELIKKMEPRARRDEALISRCIDGLGLYAAQIAAHDKFSSKIDETRKLVETLVGYWGLDNDGFTGNAKPLKEFLGAFDDRVEEAKTGGAVVGDIFQTAHNVINGLYRYGGEMVVSQGADAMGDILDICDLMKDVARDWGFEPGVLDDMTDRLEAGVRELLDNATLPGQPVNGVVNVGYEITQAVMFDNGLGIAMAHHPDAPSPFVTWRFGIDDEGGKWYEWGHYFSTEEYAKIDYINRAGDYMEHNKVKEIPFPFAAAEAEAEQNYNMIDGVKNNEGEPKPDLTDGQTYGEIRELAPETLPENRERDKNGEKPSVLDQIRAAQAAPKQPREPKPERDRKKQETEL